MKVKNACKGCRYPVTWAAQRVQWGRCLKKGLSKEEAKAAEPRCQKCMTKYLRILTRNKAGVNNER